MQNMKDLQKGSIKIIMVIIFVILIGLISINIISSTNRRDLFNRWNAECTRQNGIVGIVYRGSFATRFECFINGKITTLNGYEQYSTGFKN